MLLALLAGLARGRRVLRELSGRGRQVYVGGRVNEYLAMWMAAALAIGAELTPISDDAWEIRSAEHRTRIVNDRVQLDDPVVLALAGDKSYCDRVAEELGIPTASPRTYRHADLERVIRTVSLRDGPLVVKPAKGTGAGAGVSVDVRSRLGLAIGLAVASTYSRTIIVERLVAAETVRLLYLDGRMIHAVRRTGVRVVGDGTSTIADLLRVAGPGGTPVPVDRFVRETLRQGGRSPDEVPPAGVSVVARWLPHGTSRTDELRTAYDEDVTDQVGEALESEIGRLVAAVGTRFAAVDLLTNDPTRPLAETGGVFLEVNTTPGLHHHCAAVQAGPCPTAVAVLRRLLDPVA